ncbi:tyrosine-type recombinase/integrase [Parabacteroides goldsteinii]|uniref:tyrosine-type recombinase/integrase n=1 Tax=Parabacteroides goldsteinii TaxID=328812 RepID=UPI0021667946|nr:site-specific integrase [Parabacteroides goldsteinii]MCS2425833.1 site-specific integrase [Parabacteroides goldsteinii]
MWYKKHLTWYTVRHACTSHWLEQGLNIVAVQRLMGHVDIRTTMRYIFVFVEQKNKALATLESTSTLKLKKKWKKLPKRQSFRAKEII